MVNCFPAVAVLAALAAGLVTSGPAGAAACANGVYRAGCAGPNGAAVVRKPPTYYPNRHSGYYNHSTVHCAKGYYNAGCVRTH
jgi:hypothetical protein